jgi:hypothetical protein
MQGEVRIISFQGEAWGGFVRKFPFEMEFVRLK